MAEFVELRMQEMLPILEKIQQTKLLSRKQISELVGKLQEHEFKIQRPARTLEDFISYFVCLRSLIGILKAQRDKHEYFHSVNEIEDKIKAVIASRFGMASINFKHDLKFWSFQINYLKDMGWMARVSDVFTEVTKLHGIKNPQLWVDASNFEWMRKPGKGIDLARKFVQLGIREHPSLLILYVQGFYLELKYIEHILKSPKLQAKLFEKENGRAIIEDQLLARTFYNLAKDACLSSETKLYLEFYKISSQFKFTKKLRKEIQTELTDEYIDDELAWDISAKITLAGKLTDSIIDSGLEIYEKGLIYKPTMKMYDYYIATLIFLETKVNNSEIKFKLIDRQNQIFERAYGNLKLSENNFTNWYHLINNIEENPMRCSSYENYPGKFTSLDILKLGLEKFPTNAQLITQDIKRLIKLYELTPRPNQNERNLKQLFNKIIISLSKIKIVTNNDATIWTDIFLYLVCCNINSKPRMVEKLIASAPPNTQADLKCLYIKYMSWTDMEQARCFYKKNSISPEISLKFHLDMARLEVLNIGGSEDKKDIFKRIKTCYENAIIGFGQNNIELWLAYISFERKLRSNENHSCQIYSRALLTLHESYRENFINAENKLGK